MEITRENLLIMIREGLTREGLNISSLEKQAKVPKDTIRDFLRGKTQILRADKLQKILHVLEPTTTISIKAFVGEDAEIFSLEKTSAEILDTVECPPGFHPSDITAIRVTGNALEPVFHEGWIIYYSRRQDIVIPPAQGTWQVPYHAGQEAVAAEPLAEFINKPCIAKLTDGRTLLRTLKQGKAPGRYRLDGYNSTDIPEAELEWTAKIVFIKPA